MRRVLLASCLLTCCLAAEAQTWSLHTDLARWATGRASVGLDLAVNDWQTVGLTWQAGLDGDWQGLDGCWGLQLDYRLWLTRRLYEGPGVGLQVATMHLPEEALTAGLTCGYGWLLSQHWNVDAAVGAGYVLRAEAGSRRHYYSTTYLALNVAYLF